MDKVLGIVAEYNPFHNGHLYHLENSKKITGAKFTIAIISGNFTQRGSTSIVDKWQKTKMAIENGIDLVIELPLLYSISSSENFADGAIKILNSLNIVNFLSFGSECNDINILNDISNILYDEPVEYKKLLSQELHKGLSFPKARENALISYFNDNKYENILKSPNNILGIEYLKALKKYDSNIQPLCVNRTEVNYNSINISNNFASATAIRNMLKSNDLENIKKVVPESSYTVILDNIKNGKVVFDLSAFEKELVYIFRRMSIDEISNLPDVCEGLEYSIKTAVSSSNKLDEIFKMIKSKRFTYTRIQRIFLYALLGISKQDIELSKKVTPYIRVLGFNENGKHLLSKISKKNPNLKIITSTKRFVDANFDNDLTLLLNKDIFATDVYSLSFSNKSLANLDFKSSIIK